MIGTRLAPLTLLAFLVLSAQAAAADLPTAVTWSSLASDRIARNVGDVLTVIVYENSTGSGSAENTVNKSTSFQGNVSAGNSAAGSTGVNEAAQLALAHSGDNAGATSRAGTMVAAISVTVDQLFSNGDLHVSGAQVLNINGERTRIGVKGRVRLADITASNTIVSTSLADATIDYDGSGLVTESSQQGLLSRALNWLGIP